jgi:hypothetical protein
VGRLEGQLAAARTRRLLKGLRPEALAKGGVRA